MAAYITSSNPAWFSLFGPNVGSEQLPVTPATRAIYIEDHYDPAVLAQLLPQADITVITEYFHHAPTDGQFTTLSYPIWLYHTSRYFHNIKIAENFETLGCFNFMIFKRRDFRLQALRTIEKFGLQTDYYTANVLEHEFQHKPRVFGDPQPNWYDFRGDYEQFLAARVFDPTAVSLIIEPIEPAWQDLIVYTEKSLYPVLSCTFPIWIGGRLQAQGWKELGFDAFDDVIDHSYQSAETSQQRMEMAIQLNLRILTDIDFAKDQRDKHLPRLLNNRKLLLEQSVRPYLDKIKQTFPPHIQNIINEIEQTWIHLKQNQTP